MKSVFAPPLGHDVKFGRIRPRIERNHLRLAKYITLPLAPSMVDYSSPATAVLADIYGNDALGDCGVAGFYHILGVLTGNAGSLFHASRAQIVSDYSAISGYVPGRPETDVGVNLSDALNYWQKHGAANGTKILGALKVNTANWNEVMSALWLFENLYLGLELPDTYTNPFPSGNGFTWDSGTPDPNQGHCIVAYGGDSTGLFIDSWGLKGKLTKAAFQKLCGDADGGECYTILTTDQVAKGAAKAPNNVAWREIIADFDSLGGTVTIPPPSIPPSPVVSGGVTLAQAQAMARSGIAKALPLMTRSQAGAASDAGLAAGWPKS